MNGWPMIVRKFSGCRPSTIANAGRRSGRTAFMPRRNWVNCIAQRAAFETERRTEFGRQSRARGAARHRSPVNVVLAAARIDELLAIRQQIEHDRTLFAAERSSESLRREQEVREHTIAKQIRLNDEQFDLQTMRSELEATSPIAGRTTD